MGCITKQRLDQVWNPPPLGFIKLNINGTMDLVLGDTSAVAVAKDDIGSWRGGVGRNIGKCNVVQVELWEIYDGRRMAWDNNWTNIMVETDYAQAMEVIPDRSCGKLYRDLISRIQELCCNILN